MRGGQEALRKPIRHGSTHGDPLVLSSAKRSSGIWMEPRLHVFTLPCVSAAKLGKGPTSCMLLFSHKLEIAHQSYFTVKIKLDPLYKVAGMAWSRLVPHKCELLILLGLREKSQYHRARRPKIDSGPTLS